MLLVICLGLIAYIYAGYPLVIHFMASNRPKMDLLYEKTAEKCSVVIAVRSERDVLLEKVRQLLVSDGEWIDEVLIGADGTIGVADCLAGLNDARIRVIEFTEQRGKTAILNDLIPQCSREIVVLMDARQRVKAQSIEALLLNFQDENVGVVSGELVFERSNDAASTAESGMGAYWRYEKWIRKNESRFASVPGATGACYALRRSLFVPIPAETLLDDVAIPMRTVMNGFRCIFEPKTIVYDLPSADSAQETIRKRRTLAGNVQLLQLFPELLLPWRNPICFQYLSHKVLRLFSPFLLIIACFLSLFGFSLTGEFVFGVSSLFFAVFVAISLMGGFLERKGVKWPGVSLCWMFFVLNKVTYLGVLDGLQGKYRVKWAQAYENSTHR